MTSRLNFGLPASLALVLASGCSDDGFSADATTANAPGTGGPATTSNPATTAPPTSGAPTSGLDPGTSSGSASDSDGPPPETSTSSGGVGPGQGFGDCINERANVACVADEVCVGDELSSVCSAPECVDPEICPVSPPGGNAPVICGEADGDPDSAECVLDCSAGQDCPTGMVCADASICMWHIDGNEQGYGDCANNPAAEVCLPGEQCVSQQGKVTGSVCSSTPCADAGDCPLSPAGGDAPVVCTDITDDAVNECALDCSNGEFCPTDMTCSDTGYCLWDIPVVTFDQVHPIFMQLCDTCHTVSGFGGHNIGAAAILTAYGDSQLAAYTKGVDTKGAATIVRILAGEMPMEAGCSGNPAMDPADPCLTQAQQDLITNWIAGGQQPPA